MLAKFWAIAAVALAGAAHAAAATASPASGSDKVTYHISLTAADQAGLDDRIAQITESGGPWLTSDELKGYVAGQSAHVEAIKAFLVSKGVHRNNIKLNDLGDRLSVHSTVDQANAIWSTSLQKRGSSSSLDMLADALQIPAHLQHMITDVYPFIGRSSSAAAVATGPHNSSSASSRVMTAAETKAAAADPNACNADLVTPECLRHFYGAGHWKPKPIDGSLDLLLLLLGGAGSDEADVHKYLHTYRPRIRDIDNYHFKLNVSEAGAEAPGSLGHGSEGFIDVEVAAGVAAPLNLGQIKYGGPETIDMSTEFTSALRYILDNYKGADLPGVISVSFGTDESQVKPRQAHELCSVVKKLTAQGATVVFASGDAGIDGSHGTREGCKDKWTPPYPGGCPYVLSVGGTQGFDPVQAVDGSKAYYSGAGFSNIFQAPKYQRRAVRQYVSTLGSVGQGKANRTSGRAFPDIAAAGLNLPVYVVGNNRTFGGTSVAAPVAASIVALANNKRQHAHKARLGFLNSRLYHHADTLVTDITHGSTGAHGCSDVLPATKGWDLASGLGYLNFDGLVNLP